MQHPMVTSPVRPSRAQIEPAALALLSRHSAGLLATARRYSASPEDAEDAYQRGVEILLTKAPTTREDELLPWARTVVKHEAYAVAKASGRAVPQEEPLAREPDEHSWTDDRAERYERLRVAAEAMAGLKPQEIRCLLLKAEGLSYQEICVATNWTYTKVNRCISEGRKAFLKRVAGIESGAECERLAPLISKVADGEASPEEMRAVRPHLKGCLACKATLREYRAAPSRLAGLVPPVVALAGGGGKVGLLARLIERLSDAGGAKVAAVAAAGAVIVGSGAAGVEAMHHDAPPVPASAYAQAADPASALSPAAPTAPIPAGAAPPDPSSAAIQAVQQAATPPSPAESASAPKATSTTPEFDPGIGAGSSSGPDPATGPQPNEFASDPVASDPLAYAPSAPAGSTAPTGSGGGSAGSSAPSKSGGGSGSGTSSAEFGP